MTRKMMYTVLQFLTYGMLVGFSFEEPLIGENVRDAREYEFPFVVAIARRAPRGSESGPYQNRNFCTGMLISRKSVLTAMHCVVRENKRITVADVEIIAGSVDVRSGEKFYPKSWTTYEMWKNQEEDPESFDDIAIITLRGFGVRNTNIKPASLALNFIDSVNSTVRIAGWGNTEVGRKPLTLKTAEVTVISNEECISNTTRFTDVSIELPETHFCSVADPWVVSAGSDSGAPIVNERNRVVGMNVGVCPPLDGYPPEFRYKNTRNCHLYLYPYREFIENVTIDSPC